jgi:N-acyl amino acid synthase of PEP-CTERM/exosortase system
LVIDRPSQIVAGAVRIILPGPDLAQSFPIQKLCKHPMLQHQNLMRGPQTAEISRFAVSKELRRRAADRRPSLRHRDFGDSGPGSVPHIMLGLLKGVLRMSLEHGIEEWFAVMEPTLLRLLTRFGIHFAPIGPMVDDHGLCVPCHANIKALLARVHQERIDVWEFATDNGRMLHQKGEGSDPLHTVH